MYAIFQIGGKQYKVNKGQILNLEKIKVEIGSFIKFDKILAISNGENIIFGYPFLSNGEILAEVIENNRFNKVKVIKFRRRKHHRKNQGHRQWFTKVKIINIKSNI